MFRMDLSYIAGFFDGEGCIHSRMRRGVYPRVQIIISQKDPFILKQIQDHFGFGRLGNNQRGIWNYRVSNPQEVLIFLESVYPHLIGKKEQARLSLIMLKNRWKDLSEEEKDYQRYLVARIIELKNERIKVKSEED